MVLVDTCVWSAALRWKKNSDTPSEALVLQRLIRQHRAVLIGPILQEVLTGIRHETQFDKLCNKLEAFEQLSITRHDYMNAARLANACRRKGIQGSHTDFLISSVAIQYQIPVFTTDKDFIRYQKHIPIALFKTDLIEGRENA